MVSFEIGVVPGCSSITNSISLSGGIPGKSSGKTSAYSHTTEISSSLDSLMANAQELVHSRNGRYRVVAPYYGEFSSTALEGISYTTPC